MGGSVSTSDGQPQLRKKENEIVHLMMPLYYIDEPLDDEELVLAKNCWTSIVTNTAPNFANLRKDAEFPHATCIVFFYHSFYERLFDIHPLSKDLFKDISTQGKFLVKMLSLSLSEKADPEKYEKTLQMLAEIHNERGIKAVEYGLVGDVLFWAISRCVGQQVYTDAVHQAWVKIFSRMLRTMVPLAVAYELRNSSAQTKRFQQTLRMSLSASADEETANAGETSLPKTSEINPVAC